MLQHRQDALVPDLKLRHMNTFLHLDMRLLSRTWASASRAISDKVKQIILMIRQLAATDPMRNTNSCLSRTTVHVKNFILSIGRTDLTIAHHSYEAWELDIVSYILHNHIV